MYEYKVHAGTVGDVEDHFICGICFFVIKDLCWFYITFFPPKLCVYCSNLLCCSILLQSRVGPVEWLKPYTDETIVELGQKGVKSLLAVPIRYG